MRRAVPSWALSFADIGLLLLGCFVMLNAMQANRPMPVLAPTPMPSVPAYRLQTLHAGDLFETGEARLRPGAHARLRGVAQGLSGGAIEVVSRGGAEGGNRLDRFELAAARAAAVARALRESGVPERRLTLRLEASAGAAGSQRIEILHR